MQLLSELTTQTVVKDFAIGHEYFGRKELRTDNGVFERRAKAAFFA